jgi:hypothetical protein
VRIENNVGPLVPERRPERGSHETVLDHQRYVGGSPLEFGVDGMVVSVKPIDAVRVGYRLRTSEMSKSGITSFVGGSESEGARVGRRLDERDHRVDNGHGLSKVSRVEPPDRAAVLSAVISIGMLTILD